MKLTNEVIKNIATGWLDSKETDGGICFQRFTKDQQELYKSITEDFYVKSTASSGIRLRFATNSKNIFIKMTPFKGSSRKYLSVDIYVGGKEAGHLDNFSDVKLPKLYSAADLPDITAQGSFFLGEGTKEVTVFLPWSAGVVINEISVDDGAEIIPVKPGKKLLAFGDSITQGYDALRPANKYISRLADALDAEEINKGIGGEVFRPALAALKDPFDPDYITVAYGTNDWATKPLSEMEENCVGFYKELVKNYPNSKIFALAPIWRKELTAPYDLFPFERVCQMICDAVKDYENVTVINCIDMVPPQEELFADYGLRPNDAGFEHYSSNLIKEIKKHI